MNYSQNVIIHILSITEKIDRLMTGFNFLSRTKSDNKLPI
jgi:hypothetical protein